MTKLSVAERPQGAAGAVEGRVVLREIRPLRRFTAARMCCVVVECITLSCAMQNMLLYSVVWWGLTANSWAG